MWGASLTLNRTCLLKSMAKKADFARHWKVLMTVVLVPDA
jgi:hypothetical protein